MASLKTEVQDYCRSLPGVTEDIKWTDHLVFSIGGKMFAVWDVDEESQSVRCKADPDMLPTLTQQEGIEPAPYLAKQGWIKIAQVSRFPREEMEDLLCDSYDLIAAKLSKRLRESLGALIRSG